MVPKSVMLVIMLEDDTENPAWSTPSWSSHWFPQCRWPEPPTGGGMESSGQGAVVALVRALQSEEAHTQARARPAELSCFPTGQTAPPL